MPLYEITDDKFSPLNSTSFQDEGLKERQDLQRLLKANISVIDPDVKVISEEFHDWKDSNRRVDLLAVDKEANLVVIELKRTNDGGHMELQALRYASMVSNMTINEAKDIFDKYIKKNALEVEAESELCEFWGVTSLDEVEFAQNVRIILAAGNFSKEITTSVLWLNEFDLDIRCVRLSLHEMRGQLVLNVEQIIPLPEAASYQVKLNRKRKEARDSKNIQKDRSLFSISYAEELYQEGFKKSDIGYHTVMLFQEKGLIDKENFEFLREDTSCSFQLLKRREEMTDSELKYGRYRYRNEPELMYSGVGYYVARNWGIGNIDPFINKVNIKFPEIKIMKI